MAIGPSIKGGFPSYLLSSFVGVALAVPATVFAASSGRQIEEVVVTAERQEASVQDTSISITAFTSEMLEDFGIKDQTDLQNFIPATVILPYDAAVRGVGRNFRSLGGDPGISTYMNGVYSEDLYTATIGSFWDMERIEILRGPQGTLYGRNAVGGAMNFIYNRPGQEFDYKFKVSAGNYDAREVYGMVNGGLIDDMLSGRFTFSNRDRDGYIEERGPVGDDLDSRGEENYTVQLNFTPTDDMEFNLRANRANVYRVMGGADGGGLVVFRGESADGLSRDFSNSQHAYRAVDPTQTNPLASNYLVGGQPVSTFTDPVTGAVIQAQYRRPGIDSNLGNDLNRIGFGENLAAANDCVLSDTDNIDGDDLCAFTNGQNFERFHQQGVQFDYNWDFSDSLSLKYIYGYNKLSYHRITDDDSAASQINDRQFYVNHEASYQSHEIQAFYDINENLSFTSGLFLYDATIDQRGDYYSHAANLPGGFNHFSQAPQATNPAGRGFDPVAATLTALNPVRVGLFSARQAYRASGRPVGPASTTILVGAWRGDPGTACTAGDFNNCLNITHGPDSKGSELLYTTKSVREAMAAYTQGVWNINDDFTLTFGVRWAEDDLRGEENLWRTINIGPPQAVAGGALVAALPYRIDPRSPFYDPAAAAAGSVNSLAAYNVFLGKLDPVTLEPVPGQQPLGATLAELSIYRIGERTDDEVTWRLNLDWDIDDSQMMYFSVTTGYRAGGYNLLFFSTTQTYDPEELIAYEIGYKSNLLDNTLQVNASTYLYDYSTIHTFGQEISLTGGTSTSVLEAPGAEIYGFEVEALWLATDRITLGGNYSYTPSEYTKSLIIGDGGDIRCPNSIIPTLNCRLDIKGNQVLNVPENKGSAWGSYLMPLGDSGTVEFLLTASWIDESFNSQYETDFDRSPAYERYDMRVTWKSPSEQWIVTGFVNNLLDEIGIRQIEGHGESEGFRRTGMVTEPRMYGVEVTYGLGTN